MFTYFQFIFQQSQEEPFIIFSYTALRVTLTRLDITIDIFYI